MKKLLFSILLGVILLGAGISLANATISVTTSQLKPTANATTCVLPSLSATAGQALVVTTQFNSATVTATIASTNGDTWSQALRATSTAGSVYIFYSPNVTAGATVATVTFSASVTSSCQEVEYAGLGTAAILDVTNASSSAGSTALKSGTSTTNFASELLIGGGLASSTGVTFTNGTGFTIKATSTIGAQEYEIVSSAAAYSTAMTISTSTAWVDTLAAFIANPTAPGTPSYSNVAANTMTVSWTSGTNSTYYSLARATSAGGTYTQITTTTSLSYGDSGLTGNTSYWYKVNGVSTAGSSTYSATSTKLMLPATPGTPTYSSIATTSLTVSWTAPIGGATYYSLARATSSNGTYAQITTTTSLSYNNSGLANSTSYWYKVFGANATGNGSYSATSTVTTSVPAPNATSVSTTMGGNGGRSGDSITITGSSFGTVATSSAATCNGGAGTGCIQFIVGGTDTVPAANVSSWTNTSITFTIPSTLASNGGVGALQIWAANASDTTPLTFYVYPNITAVTALGLDAAREYSAGDTDGLIMLSGDHFGAAGTATILGSAATQYGSVSGPCTVAGYTPTSACFEVPTSIANNVYSGTVILSRSSDSIQATTSLSIMPRITGINPSSAPAGATMQILGNHFCQTGTCPTSPNRGSGNNNVKLKGAGTSITVSVLVVGGGAGGNAGTPSENYGDGGGGGTAVTSGSYAIQSGAGITVTVGAGSAGVNSGTPSNGGISVFGTLSASGGTGVPGSSLTGGNSGNFTGGTGAGPSDDYKGGGGAGAGGNGSSFNGGPGIASSISGSAVQYGGGGASAGNPPGSGSYSGGGGAGNIGGPGGNGTANTGGGGGGSDSNDAGGNGGSGVVIISAPISAGISATGGTLTIAGGNDIWTFTSGGIWTPTFVGGGGGIVQVQNVAYNMAAVYGTGGTITLPTPTISGDTIIVAYSGQSGASPVVSDSVNGNYLSAVSSADYDGRNMVAIFYMPNAFPVSAVNLSTAYTINYAVVYEFSGLQPTNPLDSTSFNQGSTYSPVSNWSDSITTTATGDLVVGVGIAPDPMTLTQTTTFKQDYIFSTYGPLFASGIAGAAGSYPFAGTSNDYGRSDLNTASFFANSGSTVPDANFVNDTGGTGTCNGSGGAWSDGEMCATIPASTAPGVAQTTITSNGILSNVYSFIVTQATPGTPGTPTYSNVSTSTLTVNWTSGANSTYYNVARATSANGPYNQIATTTSLSYNDTGLAPGTSYWYEVSGVNGGTTGPSSAISTVTTGAITNLPPNAPSENSPVPHGQNLSVTPTFFMTATDPESNSLQYKVTIYSDGGCGSIVQTDDESASQTGWSGQNASSSQEYTSGTQGSFTVQSALSSSTTYYWKASAKDPEGSNTWTDSTTCNSFTTTSGLWTTDSGNWNIVSGQLTVIGTPTSYSQLHVTGQNLTNAVVEFKVSASNGSVGDTGAIFRADASSNRYQLGDINYPDQSFRLGVTRSGSYSMLASLSTTFLASTFYNVNASVNGSTLWEADNGQTLETPDSQISGPGFIGIGASGNNTYSYEDFAVYTSPAITLSGLPSGGSWSVLNHSGTTVNCNTGSIWDVGAYSGQIPIDYDNGGGQVAVWTNNSCSGGASALYPPVGLATDIFGGDTYSYNAGNGGTPPGLVVTASTTINISSVGLISD